MTKHIKKLDKLNARIRECEQELENIKTLPYYTLFKQQAQQTEDEKTLRSKLAELKALKQEVLIGLQEKVAVTVSGRPNEYQQLRA